MVSRVAAAVEGLADRVVDLLVAAVATGDGAVPIDVVETADEVAAIQVVDAADVVAVKEVAHEVVMMTCVASTKPLHMRQGPQSTMCQRQLLR